jgi:hypothetical protein
LEKLVEPSIANRMRRCTGFSPSAISGSARALTVETA